MLQMPPRMPHLGIVILTMVNLSTSTAMVSQGKEMVSMDFILVFESALPALLRAVCLPPERAELLHSVTIKWNLF